MSFHGRSFPSARPRRLRANPWIRDLVQEHRLTTNDLIWPVFVIEGQGASEPIASLPGVSRLSIDLLVGEVKQAADMGVNAIALFPVLPRDARTDDGREATNPDGLVARTIQAVKKAVPQIGVMCDVALDPFTSHGHDGLLQNGKILNDETVAILSQQAIMQAAAGCDVISPSDMMDGRIAAVRAALDGKGYQDVAIMSYAAKYASAFYGPFRDALQTNGLLQGDKKTYQMNPANGMEALHETALDIAEGADMVMVKPGLPYLDVIRQVKDTFQMPTFAYHVSGEYAMLMAAVQNGWLDHHKALMETMISFKRAGCDGVLTYAARDVATLIANA